MELNNWLCHPKQSQRTPILVKITKLFTTRPNPLPSLPQSIKQKSELFANHFENAFTNPKITKPINKPFNYYKSKRYNQPITPKELNTAIRKTPTPQAPTTSQTNSSRISATQVFPTIPIQCTPYPSLCPFPMENRYHHPNSQK